MPRNPLPAASVILLVILSSVVLFFGYLYRNIIWEAVVYIYTLFSDRNQISALITSFGSIGPAVFILIQMLQVVFAPMPGESTFGLVGGYLFGTTWGFFYSSIGLTLGSLLNFALGRFLGKRYVRKIIPPQQLRKLDTLVKHQGIFVFFLLFLIPGFPKDYLCLFLGMTAIPFQVFAAITIVGRIPGTITFSLLGAGFYEQHYLVVGIILLLLFGAAFITYGYKEPLYRWIEKINGKTPIR